MQIELENVSMLYHGDKETVLEDITLSVKQGETVGIIGGTGSGKTTLINLLPRFYDVTSGNVRIDGKNVKKYDLEILRKKVRHCTTESSFIPWNNT